MGFHYAQFMHEVRIFEPHFIFMGIDFIQRTFKHFSTHVVINFSKCGCPWNDVNWQIGGFKTDLPLSNVKFLQRQNIHFYFTKTPERLSRCYRMKWIFYSVKLWNSHFFRENIKFLLLHWWRNERTLSWNQNV